ncbi:hypothetical protein [Sediminicola sp. 1XM1-17]|uniref:hypothetical protein n=1 Tax=Sediminicola sp. 1XM1-17 TaxID=3127702 RepID=UPI0030783120
MKKLNHDQIQELYTFTRKHFVEHYDLQTELVDHLANGIEQQWKATLSLTFREALDREFKKFGIFGFQDVISERMKAMDKKYRGIIWRFHKEYFKIPKILLIVCLTMIYFSVLRLFETKTGYYFFWVTQIVALLPILYTSFKYRKKLNSKKRKWILEEMIFNQIGYFNLWQLPIHLLNLTFHSDKLFHNDWFLLAISFYAVCFIILLYVLVVVIPPKAEQLLTETYPEYKMVK